MDVLKFSIKTKGGKEYILGLLRKKYLLLTPEEWVRQCFIHYLLHELNYPKSLMKAEASLVYQKKQKRADIGIYHPKTGKPLMIVECKAGHHAITQKTLDQVVQYNAVLKAPFITITNGDDCYCFHVDHKAKKAEQLAEIPSFSYMVSY